MTPQEWTDVLVEMSEMWPHREPWPENAQARCYRQLRGIDASQVFRALWNCKGDHPPAPAKLEQAVAEVVASDARLTYPELPQERVDRDRMLEHIAAIKGEHGSWAEWLEAQ